MTVGTLVNTIIHVREPSGRRSFPKMAKRMLEKQVNRLVRLEHRCNSQKDDDDAVRDLHQRRVERVEPKALDGKVNGTCGREACELTRTSSKVQHLPPSMLAMIGRCPTCDEEKFLKNRSRSEGT